MLLRFVVQIPNVGTKHADSWASSDLGNYKSCNTRVWHVWPKNRLAAQRWFL